MIHGIDVSHHQDTIDWPMVRKAGVRFAFIKASEGEEYVDPMFDLNIHGAVEAGVPRAKPGTSQDICPAAIISFCRATIRWRRPGITRARCRKTPWTPPPCRPAWTLKRRGWARAASTRRCASSWKKSLP